jgi:hypothetical protein
MVEKSGVEPESLNRTYRTVTNFIYKKTLASVWMIDKNNPSSRKGRAPNIINIPAIIPVSLPLPSLRVRKNRVARTPITIQTIDTTARIIMLLPCEQSFSSGEQ